MDLLVHGTRYARSLAQAEPLKSAIVCEVDPGLSSTSDEELKGTFMLMRSGCLKYELTTLVAAYIRKTVSTMHHPVGSLSMLPREKNGCVDTELRVSPNLCAVSFCEQY